MLNGSTSPSDIRDLSTNQQTPEISTNSSHLLAPLAILEELAVIREFLHTVLTSYPPLFTLDLESIMQLGSNITMCGNFNAHHQVWNCSTNIQRDNQLLKFANQIDIDIITPTTATKFGYISTSTIDLALIKNFFFPFYITSLSELNSDHNLVEISFKFNYILPPDNSKINANWILFTNLLIDKHAHPLPIINSSNTLDLEIRNFPDDLLTAHKKLQTFLTATEIIGFNRTSKNLLRSATLQKKGTLTIKPFLTGSIKTSEKPSKIIRTNYGKKN
ncbi:putative RNA-directed DNA polymerase from transposon X-element [Caerostris darwini]|uniref:RNA-directed DNA polymerase from transposon X-element n=1 Tax=Caerostris darwini TaxID=1538125 RepID=A0AAV4SFH0_9ARAC|nr:putative RNA-directed DNA polymerase from transposon X-element [Caerostris darwini]